MKKIITAAFVCYLTLNLNAQDLEPFKSDKGKWGFKDQSGKEIVAAKYENAWNFSEGLAMIKNKKNKYGYIDGSGKEIISLQYDDASSFNEGLAKVKLNDKYGFIDKTGKEMIPMKYDDVGNFSEGLAAVRQGAVKDEKYGSLRGGKWGFIDKTGSEIIPLKYDYAGNFSEGLAYVITNKKYNFIDTKGNEISLLDYNDAGDFSEGLAKVNSGSYFDPKWGYIDKTGKIVIPMKFEDASDFSNGTARVKSNGVTKYIDKTGKTEDEKEKEKKYKELKEKQQKQAEADLIAALSRKDTLAKEILAVYDLNHEDMVVKMVSLANYVDGSLRVNAKGDFNRSEWLTYSQLIKTDYCKKANEALDKYKSNLTKYSAAAMKNELNSKIITFHEKAAKYIAACNAWADLIGMITADPEDLKAQWTLIINNNKDLVSDDESFIQFIKIYKKRNGL